MTKAKNPWADDAKQLRIMAKKNNPRASKLDMKDFKPSHPWKRRILGIMKERGWNCADVARACELQRTHIWMALTTERDLTLSVFAELCKGLMLSPTWVLTGRGERAVPA